MVGCSLQLYSRETHADTLAFGLETADWYAAHRHIEIGPM
jgi:hypothetical protein